MKSSHLNKLIFVALPIVAALILSLIHSQWGGLAPAPPMSIPDRSGPTIVPRPKAQKPTVLAPQPRADDRPPGSDVDGDYLDQRFTDDDSEIRLAVPPPMLELNPPNNWQ